MHRLPLLYLRYLVAAVIASQVFATKAEEVIVISPATPVSLVDRATATVQDALDQAVDLLGIHYRRGGASPESGFDCSGFVSHVFREGLGLVLPRSSKELSKAGENVKPEDLKPGDLVFFNTMRSAFSHVGIYLGDDQFVHAPRSGGRVRVEALGDSYWRKRFSGARRIATD